MDIHSFASLAQVRILLTPVNHIPQPLFEEYAKQIRSFDSIRLGDIPVDAKDEKVRFMPNPLSSGHMLLSFPSLPPPLSHHPLSLLRVSHFPLAVIGVATCSQAESLRPLYDHFNSSLRDLFPAGGIFPVARNLFVFEEGQESSNINHDDNMPGMIIIPSMMGNKRLYIGTLLADLCSQILGEFGVVVSALESPLGNEHLNSALMPVLPPLSDIPPPLNYSGNFNLAPAPSVKRNSSAASFRQSVLASQASKKRMSTIGTTSSHGRLYKVLGDLFLLSGRLEDATVWYTEALQLFKGSQDPVWHASVLEGMATISIIEAWSSGHGLQNSTVALRDPWSDVAERLNQATTMYLKAPISDGEETHSLLAYLYCCCVLRHSSLLFSVWSAKGWGPLAFTTMLQAGPQPYLPPTLAFDGGDVWLHLERLSMISGIPRSSISAVLAQLHGPWLLHLGSRERIGILQAMASIYACLGYKRKEAYILREVLGCIMDLMVCGREEDGVTPISSVPATAGLGIHNFNPTQGAAFGPAVGVRLYESIEGNRSILDLLKHICRVLGINLDAVQLSDTESNPPVGASVSILQYDNESNEEYQEPYGWPELQVGVVREAVAVAEALPDFPSVAQFALSSLKTLQRILSPADQYHLYSTSTRALVTAQRRGDLRLVEYWSGRPVISIAIAPLPLLRLPVEKPVSVLNTNRSDVAPLLQVGSDPFLYNPRKAAASKGNALVVQNEVLEFVVILQNPFIFDLELQSLSLSTSGVNFDSRPTRVLIPANSIHQVVLSGKATETGDLVIRGCRVQAPGGMAKEYVLPLFTPEEEERLERRRGALACEIGRSKYSGLEGFPWARSNKRQSKQIAESSSRSTFRFLQCKVIPEQPLLRIRRTSITHGALMLYDGERSIVRVTLENVSAIPINFLHLSFEDSTMAPAQQALAEGDLSAFDIYETEYDLIHRPVFSWNGEDGKTISPGQNVTLSLSCFGKVGCTNVTIHVAYSHTDEAEVSDVFYTRQISYPVTVTVYHMLECHDMDLLPFMDNIRVDDDNMTSSSLQVTEDGAWCLFSILVRNTYGLPFDVTLERHQEGVSGATSSTTIPPGSMSRIVIPLKKIILPENQTVKPIPTLSERQFVVTKSKMSKAENATQRELFWYREELFRSVKGRWQETGGTRSGHISFRQQRMTLPMLEIFRLENAHVHMELWSETSGLPVFSQGGRCYPPPNTFVCLRTEVKNLTPSSFIFTVDLELKPLECVTHEGTLSDLPTGRLEGGESRVITTVLCFLACGRFEIAAHVRTFGVPRADSKVCTGHLLAIVQEET